MGASDSRPATLAGDGSTSILTVVAADSRPDNRADNATAAARDADSLAAVAALDHPPPLLGTTGEAGAAPPGPATPASTLPAETIPAAAAALAAASDAAAAAVARLSGFAAARTGLAVERQGVVTSRVLAADIAASATLGRLRSAKADAAAVEAAAGELAGVAAAMGDLEARCAAAEAALARAADAVKGGPPRPHTHTTATSES